MKSQDYWSLFLETGAPELYMLYNRARELEDIHAPDSSGPGFEGNTL